MPSQTPPRFHLLPKPPSQLCTSLRVAPEQRWKELWVDRRDKGVRTAESGPSKGGGEAGTPRGPGKCGSERVGIERAGW